MREEELKAQWRQAEVDCPPMNIAQLREKAASFQKRARNGDLVEYITGAVVVAAFALLIWILPGAGGKLGSVTMLFATLYVMYQLRLHGAARRVPPESTAAPLLAFYRTELMRRVYVLKNTWRLFVLPIMLGMIAFTAGVLQQRSARNSLPLLILVAVWFAIGAAISMYNRSQSQRLQGEIDQLNCLERAP